MENDGQASLVLGTSIYLAHSGVKGMKWGVWNAETRKRRTRISDTKPKPLGKTVTTFVKKSAIDNISYDTAKLVGKRLIGNAAVKAALTMTADTVAPPVMSAGQAAVALVIGDPVTAIAAGSAAVAGVATAGVKAYNNQKYREKGRDEIRSLHLDKLDENVSKTNRMQKKASQKYGAESKQYKKAVKKYGKAKKKFQKEYDRLNPDY